MQIARQQAASRLLTYIGVFVVVATCHGVVVSPGSEALAVLPDITTDGACNADLVRHHCIAGKVHTIDSLFSVGSGSVDFIPGVLVN